MATHEGSTLKTYDVTVTTAEIRSAWSTIQRGESPFSARQNGSGTERHRRAGHYTGDVRQPFIGCSGAQMQDWLQNGFYPETSERQMPGGAVEITAPMVELVEEDGDLIVSQALGGEDLMYAQWQPQAATRGLTIRAHIGMAAMVEATTIAAYLEWILEVIDAAERRGVAPDVELIVGAKDGFTGGPGRMTVHIPLVKGGEIVDAVAWRAFLTPGAFRSLGFVALALAGDKIGRGLTSSLGSPVTKGWRVEFSGDALTIECPAAADSFPAALMDKLLETAYAGA
jgi:hypothetical protein